jgi:MFS family permease
MEKNIKPLTEYKAMRWGILFIVSIVMAANYYFYDALSPLQDLLRRYLGFSNTAYGFLVSAYSIPNVFLLMAVVGGIILDKIGIRITGFVFIAFMAIGSFLTAYGASDVFNSGGPGYNFMDSILKSYPPSLKMMSLGFFLFGLGAETSIVVISKVVVKWFKGKELALALGINIAIARFGTALALFLSRSLYTASYWNRPIWFASSLLAIALLAFIVYMIFDLRFDRITEFKLAHSSEDEFRLRDVIKLVKIPSFIYITLLCVTFYSAVFPFLKYATDMLENKFGLPGELSGKITSILPFGTMIFTPLFGWFADIKGKSASIMILGSLLLISVHLIFSFTSLNPYVPMFLLGVAFSLVPAAMWPSVAKIVETRKIGSAYGFMFSVQNIGLWAFPLIIGLILDISNPYYRTELNSNELNGVIEKGFVYNGVYMKKLNKPHSEKSFKAKVNVMTLTDKKEEKIIWYESHKVKCDSIGRYIIPIGQGSEILNVDIQRMRLLQDTFFYEIRKIDKESEKTIVSERMNINKNFSFSIENNVTSGLLKKDKLKIIITTKKTGGEIVWGEIQKYAEIQKNNNLIILGNGKIISANKNYFKWHSENYSTVITTPLDYSNAVLLLSLLGVLGLLFAFLLKREDKVSGFGLELPNKTE